MDTEVEDADHSMISDTADSSNDSCCASSGNSVLGGCIQNLSDEIEMVLNVAVGQLEKRILALDKYFEKLNIMVSSFKAENLHLRTPTESSEGTIDIWKDELRNCRKCLFRLSFPDTRGLHDFYFSTRPVVSKLSKLLFEFEERCNNIACELGQIYICFSDIESNARDVKRFAVMRNRSPVERSLVIFAKYTHIHDVIESNKSKEKSSKGTTEMNSQIVSTKGLAKGEKDLSKKLVESESEMDQSNTLDSETNKDSTDECSEVDTNLSTSKDEQSDTSKHSDTTKGEKDLSKKLVEEESEMDNSNTLDSETNKDSTNECSEVDTNGRSIKDEKSDASEQRTEDESAEVETGESSSKDELSEEQGTVYEELENVLDTLTNKCQSKLIEIIHRYMDAHCNAKEAIGKHFEIEGLLAVDEIEKTLAVLEDNLSVMEAVGEEVKRNFESYKESFKEFHFYIEQTVCYRVP